MGVFIQAPFWGTARRPGPFRARSVLVTPPAVEPLTLDQAKLRAGLDWAPGDPRDALMTGFIAAARAQVEQDTGIALIAQTRDVFLDAFPPHILTLPALSRPLQSVVSVKSTDTAGVINTMDPGTYIVDLPDARIGLPYGGYWPMDLRAVQPIEIRIIVGYADVAALTAAAPLLVHAVGLLTAHYATLGRDLASIDTAEEVPQGYEAAIESYKPVTLA